MRKVLGFESDKWMILSVTALGAFLFTLNISMLNLALPLITDYYKVSLGSAEWVILIYLLLMSSLMLTFGRMGDLYGYRTIYVLGFAVFTVSSFFCVLAPNILSLIIARAFQAIGAGMAMSLTQAIIADSFPPAVRGRAIGMNVIFVSLGLAAGPSIGGVILNYFSWRMIFIINIPIGLLCTCWPLYVLPKKQGKSQVFDIPGALLLFLCLMSFMLSMTHGQEWGWSSKITLGLFILTFIALLLFIYREIHFAYPVVKLGLFKNRLFTASNIAAILNYITQYIVTFLMPFYLLNVLHLASNKAGLVMAAFPAAMMLMSPFSGVISDRIGAQIPSSVGMGIIAVSIFLLSTLSTVANLAFVVVGLFLSGLGTGLFVSPNNDAILSSVPKEQIGLASGMIATMRSIGQALGIALAGAVFSSRLAYYGALAQIKEGNLLYQETIFVQAQHDTYLVAACIGILGMIVSLVRGTQTKKELQQQIFK